MTRALAIMGLTILQLVLGVWMTALVPAGVVWLVIAGVGVLYGLFLRLSPLRSFALLVAAVGVMAFAAVIEGWRYGWDLSAQMRSIVLQLVVAGMVCAAWVQVTELRKWARQHAEAERQAAALRKWDEVVSVLSANEFKDRLEAMVVSLRRRSEPGMLLLVSVPSRVVGFGGRRYTPEAVLHIIGETALASVRDRFDIVGRISPDTIAIALQRCDRTGGHRVLRRFAELLRQQRRIRADTVLSWVRLEEIPVHLGWTGVEAWLEACTEGERGSRRKEGG